MVAPDTVDIRQEALGGADATARREREKLDALLTFAPAFILSITRDGKIDFINRTLPQYTREGTIGASWLQYFDPSKHAFMSELLAAVLDTGATRSYELSTAGPDGSLVWFDCRIAPMRVDGQIVGAVLVSQDATERKHAQAELLAGRPMALLGTLASGIAHEINTPVQFIGDSVQFLRGATQGLLELFDKLQALRLAAGQGASLGEMIAAASTAEADADLEYLRVHVPKAFESCITGLDRVAKIVRSLKDFAHPSEEGMVAADINRAVETAATIAQSEYKAVADLKLDLGELPTVECRPSEIMQVVLNIIVNAAHAIETVARATGERGLITVKTRQEGDAVVISVRDTGTGIPEAIRARIFDPFFTTKDVGKGTGQGLMLARTTVNEHHQGQLTFETEVSVGTTFFVRLPIVRARGLAANAA